MRGDAGLVSLGEGLRKTNPITFDNQVQVQVRNAQEKIPDEPTHGVHANATSFSEFTRLLQERQKRDGQSVLHVGTKPAVFVGSG